MTPARTPDLNSFLAKHAAKLRGGMIDGRRRWFETLLQIAPRVAALVEGRRYRELGSSMPVVPLPAHFAELLCPASTASGGHCDARFLR